MIVIRFHHCCSRVHIPTVFGCFPLAFRRSVCFVSFPPGSCYTYPLDHL